MFLGQSLDTEGEQSHIKQIILIYENINDMTETNSLNTNGLKRQSSESFWLEHLVPVGLEEVQGGPLVLQ